MNRQHWLIILLVAVSSLSLSQAPEAKATTSRAEVSLISIIGDSFTAGSPMGGRGGNSWPALAREMLRSRGTEIEIQVGADPGSGYVASGHKGTVFGDHVSSTVGEDTRVAVLFGSVNDGSVPAARLARAVENTLMRVRRVAPNAMLLVIGPPWSNRYAPIRVLRDRDVVQDQTNRFGGKFVDPITEGWFDDYPEFIGSDGVHPNDAGHAYLAERIAPLIVQELCAHN